MSSGFVVEFLPVEIATTSNDAVPDFVNAIADELGAPIADEEEDGAMYRKGFAKAEERVAAKREIESLRAIIDRAGALAGQNATAGMIRSALAEAVSSSRMSIEIPDAYRWDVGDTSRGPFGETETGRKAS